MAERDDDAQHEILRLRDRLHKAENMLTAHQLLVDFIPDLVAFKNKAVGIVIGLSVVVSAATAVVVKVIG